MVYLVLDTETTGITPSDSDGCTPHYTKLEFYNFSRILQFSWCIIDQKDTVVKIQDHIVSNDFKISNSHIHGITSEICAEKGIEIEEIITKFATDLKDIRLLVGHNPYFDLNIIKSEAHRILVHTENTELKQKCEFVISQLDRIEVFDTMSSATMLKISSKYPKLTELYKLLFNEDFIGAHNAMNDILATARCFLKMVFGTTLILK